MRRAAGLVRLGVVAVLLGSLVAPDTAGAAESPRLDVSHTSLVEGDALNGAAVFMVRLSGPSAEDVAFTFALDAGTAVPGDDYVRRTRRFTIPAGRTTHPIAIDVKGDTIDEANETFSVRLFDVIGAVVGSDTATATIFDDDPGPANGLGVGDPSTFEGDEGVGAVVFIFRVSTVQPVDVSIGYETRVGTAGVGDFRSDTGIVVIPAGLRSVRLSVKVRGDENDESDEQFTLVIRSATNATVTRGTGTATIIDDDAAPVV